VYAGRPCCHAFSNALLTLHLSALAYRFCVSIHQWRIFRFRFGNTLMARTRTRTNITCIVTPAHHAELRRSEHA